MYYNIDKPIKVIAWGELLQPCGFWHRGRRLPYSLLIYLTEGTLSVKIEKETFDMRRGDIIIIPAGTYYAPLETDGCSYKYIHFNATLRCDNIENADGEADDQRLHLCEPSPILELDILTRTNESSQIRDIFRRISAVNPYRNQVEKHLIDLHFKEILVLASREIRETARYNSKFSEIVEYIRENYYLDLTSAKLSRRFRVSESYIARSFKEAAGVSPMELIHKIRIDKAAAMIFETSQTLIDIASYVGYKNKTSFTRMFKKFRGISPSEYKKQLKEEKASH